MEVCVRQKMVRQSALAVVTLLSACSIHDSHLAERAKTSLLGMNELTLQTCMGSPDEKSVFGKSEVLTYYATSTSSSSYSIPVIGGIGFSNGGYCHTIVRLDDGLVTDVRYVGETRAFAAPDAYCAPSVGGCVTNPPPPSPMPGAAPAASAALLEPPKPEG
jgi:hypothetical protein